MKHTKTVTLDSLSNVNDMVAEGLYEGLEGFYEEAHLGAGEFGLELSGIEADEDQDLITATVAFDNIQDLKDWMMNTSPELSSEDCDDILGV